MLTMILLMVGFIIVFTCLIIFFRSKDKIYKKRCDAVDKMICPDCKGRLVIIEKIPWGFKAMCIDCGSKFTRKYMEY